MRISFHRIIVHDSLKKAHFDYWLVRKETEFHKSGMLGPVCDLSAAFAGTYTLRTSLDESIFGAKIRRAHAHGSKQVRGSEGGVGR